MIRSLLSDGIWKTRRQGFEADATVINLTKMKQVQQVEVVEFHHIFLILFTLLLDFRTSLSNSSLFKFKVIIHCCHVCSDCGAVETSDIHTLKKIGNNVM